MKTLTVQPVRTRIFKTSENLVDFVVDHVDSFLVKEFMVVAITSKIVSLAENRLVDRSSISKRDLITREADENLGEVAHGSFLTIKHGLFILSAGIDESNSEGDQYILYPEDPFLSAKNLWQGLRERWKLKQLGVILTDSHTTPLRRGVTGLALSHWGFRGLKDLVGSPDLFGRKMKMTTVNVADSLAVTATLLMGEANEAQPIAILQNAPVEFVDTIDRTELIMPLEEDLYAPFFKR
jgi:F420-0:gamma-glutamyl ligase